MALASDIMTGGHSAFGSRSIQGLVSPTTLAAAGTIITDATDLIRSINYVATVASGAGVQLMPMNPGESQIVFNAGANILKVYPPTSSASINQATAGAAVSLPINTFCQYHCITSTIYIGNQSA